MYVVLSTTINGVPMAFLPLQYIGTGEMGGLLLPFFLPLVVVVVH